MTDEDATPLRRRILDRELLLGMFVDLGSPVTAEIAAGAGFDWLVLDAEHGALGPAPLFGQLQAVAAGSAAPFVRVPSPGSELMGWALDAGAAGIVVPRSESVADARAAVAATRYASTRGAAPGVRAAGYGRDPEYLPNADDRRVLMIQIETAPALDAVGEIAAIDGVDVLFLGPADLARELGLLGAAADHPQILEAAARIAAAAPPGRRPPASTSTTPATRPSTVSSATRSSARARTPACCAARWIRASPDSPNTPAPLHPAETTQRAMRARPTDLRRGSYCLRAVDELEVERALATGDRCLGEHAGHDADVSRAVADGVGADGRLGPGADLVEAPDGARADVTDDLPGGDAQLLALEADHRLGRLGAEHAVRAAVRKGVGAPVQQRLLDLRDRGPFWFWVREIRVRPPSGLGRSSAIACKSASPANNAD